MNLTSCPSKAAGRTLQISIRAICKLRVATETGDVLGTVEDVMIDWRHWSVRYLILDTGTWLPGPKVVVAPDQFLVGQWDVSEATVVSSLSRQQIKGSPRLEDLDTGVAMAGGRGRWNEELEDFQEDTPALGTSPPYRWSAPGKGELIRHRKALILWSELLRFEVRDGNGLRIGRADDFLVSLPRWRLTTMAIDVGTILNKRCLFTGTCMIERFSLEHQALHLSVGKRDRSGGTRS